MSIRMPGAATQGKSRSPASPRTRERDGSLLIEFAFALVLLSLALIPMAGALLALSGRQTTLQTRLASPAGASGNAVGPSASPGDDSQWSWGSRAGVAAWGVGEGIQLHILGRGTGGVDLVGLWVDGWAVEELPVQSGARVSLGSQLDWDEIAGAEVLVRARREGGAWGPPLRLVAPEGSLGEATVASAAEDFPPSVLHLPGAGEIAASLSGEDVPPASDIGPLMLPPLLPGVAVLSTGLGEQAWMAEAERSLDVYL